MVVYWRRGLISFAALVNAQPVECGGEDRARRRRHLSSGTTTTSRRSTSAASRRRPPSLDSRVFVGVNQPDAAARVLTMCTERRLARTRPLSAADRLQLRRSATAGDCTARAVPSSAVVRIVRQHSRDVDVRRTTAVSLRQSSLLGARLQRPIMRRFGNNRACCGDILVLSFAVGGEGEDLA